MFLFKRIVVFIIALFAIVTAVTISGLNTQLVHLDLYLYELDVSLGLLIISVLFIGLISGLLLFLLGYYLPLTSQVRKLSRQNKQISTSSND
jgi:uncharacterized membrane protein YciS (DUF1049 family)